MKRLLSIQNPKSLVGSWLFTILWCGISFTVFYTFAFKARDVMGGAIGGLFTLIGIAALYASIKATLEYLKYGEVYLQLEGEPAVGEGFGARINLPAAAAAAGRLTAVLACVRVTWSRGNKSVSKGEQDAWKKEQVFPVRRSGVGGYAALRIEIPPDKPASDLPEESAPDAMVEVGHPGGVELGRDYYRWELRLKADVPGIDFERTFRLRVNPGKQPAAAPEARRVDPVMADTALHERLITRREATRSLGTLSAFVAFVPFVVPFAIAGIAIGLAGCPGSWSSTSPPVCEFAGVNWGRLMTGAFDLMFTAFPVAGIGASIVIYFAGQAWIARDEAGSAAGMLKLAAPAAAALAVGLFVLLAWHRPAKVQSPAAAQPAPAARQDAPPVGRSAATGEWQQQETFEERLKQSLASIERSGNAGRPVAALALYRLSQEHEEKKRTADQEQALLRALAILESYPDAEVKAELGAGGSGLDKEVVARRLADIYWDQRDYARAYDHYERAYRYASEVQASDSSLNLRLARNSAGRMATACMLGNWEVADAAMAELKARIGRTDAAEQKRLEYWIRTGEPRLRSRNC